MNLKVKTHTTGKRFFLIILPILVGCIFTVSQCYKVGISDDEIFPIDTWSYSKVAFIARIKDNSAEWSLCTMDASGNGMRKIVDKTVSCQKPARSHFGTKLLFTSVKFDSWTNEDNSVGTSSEYELYVVNTDGTNLILIDHIRTTESGTFGSVAWSPDDSQIIYVKYSGASWENRDLILYNISDNTHTTLQTGRNVCSPIFSPNGKQIIYCATTGTGHHIYKMDVNGNNNQLFISNASSPKWSPQGNKIVYASSGVGGSSQIFVANADGSGQKQLTSTVSPQIWPGWAPDGNGDPQWTPNGKKIVYVSWENGRAEIFIMNADGSNQTRLTTAEYRDENPEITPDGQYILFSSVQEDMIGGLNPGICIITLDGKNQKVLYRTGICPIACK
jgi:TolB protein